MGREKEYTKSDCLSSLKEAADILGESPSKRQYEDLDINPSSAVIRNRFGSWNKAKSEADLDTVLSHSIMRQKPECVNLSNEEWKNISHQKRHRLRKKCKIAKIKVERGCKNCGYDKKHTALDFHHKNSSEKKFSINKSVKFNKSLEEIESEIEKCIILCANCHRELQESIIEV